MKTIRVETKDFKSDATGWDSYYVTYTTADGRVIEQYRVIYTIEGDPAILDCTDTGS